MSEAAPPQIILMSVFVRSGLQVLGEPGAGNVGRTVHGGGGGVRSSGQYHNHDFY